MKLKLQEIKNEAINTKTFIFSKPRGFHYLPGQYIYLTVPKLKHKDQRGATRHFTLSSSPSESFLSITTRLRKESGFKQTLKELSKGNELDAEGPNGTFILDKHEEGDHVFLAGGIGITPFRSFIKYSLDNNLKNTFTVLYSNTKVNEITFRDELKSWESKHNNVKVILTVTKPISKPAWKGETGRITRDLIKKTVSNLKSKTFWIVGPPQMVSAMENELKALKIDSNNVRSEKFTGY